MTIKNNKDDNKLKGLSPTAFSQTFLHGTRADLKVGDLIEVGFNSNFGQKKKSMPLILRLPAVGTTQQGSVG